MQNFNDEERRWRMGLKIGFRIAAGIVLTFVGLIILGEYLAGVRAQQEKEAVIALRAKEKADFEYTISHPTTVYSHFEDRLPSQNTESYSAPPQYQPYQSNGGGGAPYGAGGVRLDQPSVNPYGSGGGGITSETAGASTRGGNVQIHP